MRRFFADAVQPASEGATWLRSGTKTGRLIAARALADVLGARCLEDNEKAHHKADHIARVLRAGSATISLR
jgi:hypothetical protein